MANTANKTVGWDYVGDIGAIAINPNVSLRPEANCL